MDSTFKKHLMNIALVNAMLTANSPDYIIKKPKRRDQGLSKTPSSEGHKESGNSWRVKDKEHRKQIKAKRNARRRKAHR